MAQGRKCKKCKESYMYAIKEIYTPDGTDVVYECPRQTCKAVVRVFEKK